MIQKLTNNGLFKTLFISNALLLTTLIISQLFSCNRTEKLNSAAMKKQIITDLEKSETFQELGFFGNIKEDKWDDFLHAVQNNVVNSRKEPGNLSFSIFQPENGNLQPIWFERFENKEAHNYHKDQQYFKDAIEVIQKSLAGEAKSIPLKEVKEIPVTIPLSANQPERSRHIIIRYDIKPEKRQSYVNSMVKLVPIVRNSKGNLGFNLYQYADDPNTFIVLADWVSMAELEVELREGLIRKFNAQMKDFFVSDPMDNHWVVKDISLKK